MALGAIERGQGLATPSQVGSELDLRSSNLAALIGDLDDRGLIRRTPDATDRRRTRLSITDEGARLVKEAREGRDLWLVGAMRACLTADEQAQLVAAGELIGRLVPYDHNALAQPPAKTNADHPASPSKEV